MACPLAVPCCSGRVEHIWSWLAQHRDEVVGYAVVDDMDLSEESDATGRTDSQRLSGGSDGKWEGAFRVYHNFEVSTFWM